MRMKNQQGFAHVMAVVFAVFVLAVIGSTGYFVWHRQHMTPSPTSNKTQAKTSSMIACNVGGKSVQGELFSPANDAYAICIPDGWKLVDETQSSVNLLADASGLTYKGGTKPSIEKTTDGKDGPFAFTLEYSNPSPDLLEGYTSVHAFNAANVVGSKYTRTQVAQSGAGLGSIPVGTQQCAYLFNTKSGSGVEIDYNVFPGDTSQLSLVEKVIATFRFN